MCLVAFASGKLLGGRYSFVMAANRDEYFNRPSAAATWWQDQPHVFAGKDLQAGGTWLGVNRYGQFAVVTNWRMGVQGKKMLVSRGQWAVQALQKTSAAMTQDSNYMRQLMRQSGPGHLLSGHLNSANVTYCGHNASESFEIPAVEHGIHGLSNGAFNAPWPKTERLKKDLASALEKHSSNRQSVGAIGAEYALINHLFGALSRPTPYPSEQLPSTGVSPALEQLLSSAYITGDDYGTRVSTLVLAQADGRCVFIERARDLTEVKLEFIAQSV